MLLCFVPNGVMSDSVTKVVASRCQPLNGSSYDSVAVGSNETTICKPSIENQCGVMATYLIRNAVQVNPLPKLVLVGLDVQKNLPNYIHVALHS